jgi:hypothetical protein|tara:strand:- start:12547 stop:12699 length:153 start_codon:yes stop_codon:yes gene_type:complete
MVTVNQDTRVRSIEPPKVSNVRGVSSPDANNMIDDLLESAGMTNRGGGSA